MNNATIDTVNLPAGTVLYLPPPPKGCFSLTPDFFVAFYVTQYPNAMHRFMQRWMLGIYWRRV